MSEPGLGLAACEHCGQHIEFPLEGAATAVACPHCRQETVLQEIAPDLVAAPEPSEITAAELKDAIVGTVAPQRVSVLYQFGLLLVAMFMVLLPVVYLVFAVLLRLGHAAQCFLSRQMEFHADACAMAVAGSDGLESLLLRLREQTVLQQLAGHRLKASWKQRKLPDNLPDFLMQLEQRQPPTFHEEARLTLLNETAGVFATHPTPAQRIQKARQKALAGVFHMEKPARWLFSDFTGTARLVTGVYYRVDLDLPVTQPMLRPVSEFFPASGPS